MAIGNKELFHSAVRHHRAGRLEKAEHIYRTILQDEPENPHALHFLGVIANQSGDFGTAVDLLTRAVAVAPDFAIAHFHLGNALKQQARLPDAEIALRRAIALQPELAPAHSALAAVLSRQGRLDEAETSLRQSLTLKPEDPITHNDLGNLLSSQGRLNEAEASLRRAIGVNREYAEAHYNLGVLLRGQGLLDEATACFRRAIDYKPELPEPYINLGDLLETQGRSMEAETLLRRAIALKPDNPEAYNNLGNTLSSLGRIAEAESSLRHAIRLRPDYPEALYNLGTLLRYTGRLAEAEKLLRRSIDLQPDNPEAHNNLGTVLQDQGRFTEAEASLRRALALKEDFTKAHSNLVFYMNYVAGTTPDALYRAHCRWDEIQAARFRVQWRGFRNDPDPDRRLRVGYVSPDFREHSVAYFFAPLLANHNPRDLETYLYSDTTAADDTTRRLEGLANRWYATSSFSDDRLAEQIRADRIDVLVDLAGHTANNRLLVFARRPAPVQFTYLGYPNTTGLSSIDYRITDRWADPPGSADGYCSEELIRLQDGFLCYEPPQDAPLPVAPPLETTGYLTFGSFNERAKITTDVLAAWCAILAALPDSRVLLKCRSFADAQTRASCLAVFKAHHIHPDRVQLTGSLAGRREHLALYHQIDIALDTFPYNGATTTCEALWMGVPVITLTGNTHAGRVGASLLHSLGLESLITGSVDEYLSLACGLASDRAKLSWFHATLREQFRQSPLCDGGRIAGSMEQAIRQGWRHWCKNPGS